MPRGKFAEIVQTGMRERQQPAPGMSPVVAPQAEALANNAQADAAPSPLKINLRQIHMAMSCPIKNDIRAL